RSAMSAPHATHAYDRTLRPKSSPSDRPELRMTRTYLNSRRVRSRALSGLRVRDILPRGLEDPLAPSPGWSYSRAGARRDRAHQRRRNGPADRRSEPIPGRWISRLRALLRSPRAGPRGVLAVTRIRATPRRRARRDLGSPAPALSI